VAGVGGILRDSAVDPKRVAAMSSVASREPVVLTGAGGVPLAPAISWTDRRPAGEARQVSARFGRSWPIEKTGMAPAAGATVTHLRWLKRHRPDAWRSARHIVFAKDYVLYRLTGQLTTDVSTPGRSLMLDIRRGDWSPEICDAFEIDVELLPSIGERPWAPVAELRRTQAELGLHAGLRLAIGGVDDAAATLGAGAIEVGEMCVGTGTATNWRSVLDDCRPDANRRGDLVPHVVPRRYIFEVAIDSTGSSLRWLRDTFAAHESFEAQIEDASGVAAGADGLLFYPYVDGAARAPRCLPDAKGAFAGIVSGHTRAHLVCALLEGVAYQCPATMAIVSAHGAVRPPIATRDGEARNALWNQIKPDVLGMPLRVPQIVELAATGAAILAGVFVDAASRVERLVRWEREFEPDPVRYAAYEVLRVEYERVVSEIGPPHDKETTHDH
jgi:sugar (pentulose or hexulose) kinase